VAIKSARSNKPDDVTLVDESDLPAPTKFKKEKHSNICSWKIGRSNSAPSSNGSTSGRPAQELENTDDTFIKAVILVRTA
jgi:hypothetical protein